jgi:hypothetical protein
LAADVLSLGLAASDLIKSVSDPAAILVHMFEIDLPLPETISTMDDDELLDAIALAAGFESVVVACKLVAIDEYAWRLAAAKRPCSGPPRPPLPRRPSSRRAKRRRRKRRQRRRV